MGGSLTWQNGINSYRADNSDSTVALRSLSTVTREMQIISVFVFQGCMVHTTCQPVKPGSRWLSGSHTGLHQDGEVTSSSHPFLGSGTVHAGSFQVVSHLGSHIPSSKVELLCAACL